MKTCSAALPLPPGYSAPLGENILPKLLDVRITGFATGGMNLTGVEMIDDAAHPSRGGAALSKVAIHA
jgi:hypothetical protein